MPTYEKGLHQVKSIKAMKQTLCFHCKGFRSQPYVSEDIATVFWGTIRVIHVVFLPNGKMATAKFCSFAVREQKWFYRKTVSAQIFFKFLEES
jgi:hypothetical protein